MVGSLLSHHCRRHQRRPPPANVPWKRAAKVLRPTRHSVVACAKIAQRARSESEPAQHRHPLAVSAERIWSGSGERAAAPAISSARVAMATAKEHNADGPKVKTQRRRPRVTSPQTVVARAPNRHPLFKLQTCPRIIETLTREGRVQDDLGPVRVRGANATMSVMVDELQAKSATHVRRTSRTITSPNIRRRSERSRKPRMTMRPASTTMLQWKERSRLPRQKMPRSLPPRLRSIFRLSSAAGAPQ